MLKILYIILLFLINISLDAQSTEIIVPFYNNGKWGFMNKNKDIIVCPKYEEAYPSTSDRYRVKIKGKYGYIDQIGKLVIKAKYDEAKDFKYGRATVTRRGKTIAITRDGKSNNDMIALCGNHSCLHPRISNTLEVVEDSGKFGIIHDMYFVNEQNKGACRPDTIHPIFDYIIPISHELMYLKKDSLIAFLRVGKYWSGGENVINNLKFEIDDIELFNCSFCQEGIIDIIGIKKNGLWGYMKVYFLAEKFIEPKYLRINSLADGFALVEYEDQKFGYIDHIGNEYFIR